MVTQKYTGFNESNIRQAGDPDYPADRPMGGLVDLDAKEVPHVGFGGGLHIALNENFIVTVD